MNPKEMSQQVRLAHWAGVMRERNESGESVRSWCRENGISEKTYYYWQRKLREAACLQLTRVQTSRQSNPSAPVFAEVKVDVAPVPLSLPGEIQPGHIRVEIGQMKITVDSMYPPDKLTALLRELVRTC